jgi:hypothetical protein
LLLGKLFKNNDRGYGYGYDYDYDYGNGYIKHNNRFGEGVRDSRFNGGRNGKGSFFGNNHRHQLNAADDDDEGRSLLLGKFFKNNDRGYGYGCDYDYDHGNGYIKH